MKQIPRYRKIPEGLGDLALVAFGLGKNNAARLLWYLAGRNVWGDRLKGEPKVWLESWAAERFPGLGLNMLLVVQVSRAEAAEALGVCEKTVRRSFARLVDMGLLFRIHDAKGYEPPLYAFPPCVCCEGGNEPGETVPPDVSEGGQKRGVRVDTCNSLTWGARPGIINNKTITINGGVDPTVTVRPPRSVPAALSAHGPPP